MEQADNKILLDMRFIFAYLVFSLLYNIDIIIDSLPGS